MRRGELGGELDGVRWRGGETSVIQMREWSSLWVTASSVECWIVD